MMCRKWGGRPGGPAAAAFVAAARAPCRSRRHRRGRAPPPTPPPPPMSPPAPPMSLPPPPALPPALLPALSARGGCPPLPFHPAPPSTIMAPLAAARTRSPRTGGSAAAAGAARKHRGVLVWAVLSLAARARLAGGRLEAYTAFVGDALAVRQVPLPAGGFVAAADAVVAADSG